MSSKLNYHLRSVLEFVLYELEENKKYHVSLVVQYKWNSFLMNQYLCLCVTPYCILNKITFDIFEFFTSLSKN